MSEIFTIANFLRNEAQFPVILATLVSVEGSSYRRTGARRVICPDGNVVGSISGGCLEEDLDERAITLLNSTDRHELVVYDTTSENDLIWGVGTGCHGVVKVHLEKLDELLVWPKKIIETATRRQTSILATRWKTQSGNNDELGTQLDGQASEGEGVFIHPVFPAGRVIIFGAGDDALPLCHQITALGWRAVICDPRPGLISLERFSAAEVRVHLPAENAATHFDWDDHTAAIVMTHHYRFDLPILRSLVPLHLSFLGLLGPKARGERLLCDAGFDPGNTDLHNPIGLDLGGDGPEAIALAIVAEIQAHWNQRSGRPLRERSQPIHDGSSDR